MVLCLFYLFVSLVDDSLLCDGNIHLFFIFVHDGFSFGPNNKISKFSVAVHYLFNRHCKRLAGGFFTIIIWSKMTSKLFMDVESTISLPGT